MKNEALKTALLEVGRYIVLGIVSWLLAGGVDILLGFFNTVLPSETRLVISAVLLAVLRAVDKYLHEKGKAEENENLIKGLTRF